MSASRSGASLAVRGGRGVAQAVVYAGLMWAIGYFASAPVYTYLPAGMAQVRVSFSHAGKHVSECHRRTPEEMAALAPNMRRPLDCPRERLPVLFRFMLDGKPLFSDTLQPGGLARDGAAMIYRRFRVPAGRHRIEAALRDSHRDAGFDYRRAATVDLRAAQNFVVEFDRNRGGFRFIAGGGGRT